MRGVRPHQENLKLLNRTLAALNRLLSTFQDHFFQGRSRQVVSLILCLVCLESFLMRLNLAMVSSLCLAF